MAKQTEPRSRPLKAILESLPERPVPLLGSWLCETQQTMIYAASGVGKSFFSLSIALAIAGGGSFMDWQTGEPRKVLYVDGEMSLHDVADRTDLLLNALPGVDRDVALRNCELMAFRDQPLDGRFVELNQDKDRDFLVEKVAKQEFALVALDNFSTLVSVEDENAASNIDPVIDLMRRLQRAGAAVILVHHARKNGGGKGSYRGSQKLSVTCDNIIRLDAHDTGLSDGSVAFKAEWEKVRAKRTEEVREREVYLRDGQWDFTISSKPELMQLVLAVRSRDHTTQDEIAEALGVSKATISKRKKDVLSRDLMTIDEWNRCLEEAADIQSEEAEEDDGDF